MGLWPTRVGYHERSGVWAFTDAPPTTAGYVWWDISDWTVDDCAAFMAEESDEQRLVALALEPIIRVTGGAA